METITLKLDLKISGYSLHSNLNNMEVLINDTINDFRLDEEDRINDITKMHISGLERNLTSSGHYFAMTSSDAKISKWGAISEVSGGLSYLKRIKELKLSNGDIEVSKLISIFSDLKQKIINKPETQVLVTSEEVNNVSSIDNKREQK